MWAFFFRLENFLANFFIFIWTNRERYFILLILACLKDDFFIDENNSLG
jgi:hypothetical protein